MNILTFDVEEWFHILGNASTRSDKEWQRYESRISTNVDRLFTLLEEKRIRATFFCLGWVAEKYPDIIKRIHSLGYEIGTHSYAHQLAYEQTPSEFSEDLRRSLAILEDLIGSKVRAYRAPGFSLTKENQWVFDILIENGIEVDSSIFLASREHGGFADFGMAEPVLVQCNGGVIKEFPVSVWSVLGKSIVFAGGGYFRLFPYPLIKELARRSQYLMTYFHPRDFDPDQPLIKELNLIRRFKSYHGLAQAEHKLRCFLDDFEFIDLQTADKIIDWTACKRLSLV